LEICGAYDITPEDLLYKWEAYIDKHPGDDIPKIEHFESLKAEIARKSIVKQEKGPLNIAQRHGTRQ
jgi:hypothetical protein